MIKQQFGTELLTQNPQAMLTAVLMTRDICKTSGLQEMIGWHTFVF